MLKRLRERTGSEKGFTLIELLVVMLILGILAAIAIPAFVNQKDKANDAKAKSVARSAVTAMETLSTENGGSYNCGTSAQCADDLNRIEPTVPDDMTVQYLGGIFNLEYQITTPANLTNTGNTFTLRRTTGGAITSACATHGDGGCPESGNWTQ